MEGYIFDYRLGYIRGDCDMQGFDVIGKDDPACGSVVVLGGYTTPEMAKNGESWAHALYTKLEGKFNILNGCTDGYSSAQILTLFIRDVILFRPKVVVCLSGFYNLAYKLGFVQNKPDSGFLKTHPFATPGHLHFYRKITARFGIGNDEVFYGVENDLSVWELWLRQMREVKCLCDAFGIGFKSLLQPCVFSGQYRRNERENAFLCEHYALTKRELSEYHVKFQREYDEILSHAKNLDYIVDLSGLFDKNEDVYTDACHVRDAFLPKLVEVIV